MIGPLALLTLAAPAGRAQTAPPAGTFGLLHPSIDGNPGGAPGPGVSAATASSMADAWEADDESSPVSGEMPGYGSPKGFGAGNTGFDSGNTRRKRHARDTPPAAQAKTANETFAPVPAPAADVSSIPPAPPPVPPPEIYPAPAASRPGAALPPPVLPLPLSNPPAEVHPLVAALRRGAVLPVPPDLDISSSASTPPPGTPQPNTLPPGTARPLLPIAAIDPYEALGIRAGSFLILPSLDLSAGYDTNPQHIPNGAASSTFVVSPELHVRSDWSRHAFTADITGAYYAYGNDDAFTPQLNRPYLNARLDGRIDVTRDTQILLENRYIVSTDNPGSPNIQAGLARLPIDTTVGGTVGVAQQLSRFDVSLKGTIDRINYQNSELTDGESVSNDTRNYNQYGGILRLGYEVDPGLKPFVELGADSRIHDIEFDAYGEDRDSTGTSAKIGTVLNLSGELRGEIAAGYLQRDYHDPTLPNIGGVTLDGSLLWQISGLTTAKFTAASAVNESVLQGVSGTFSRDFNLEVDHALRRWLIVTARAGYGNDDYAGLARIDNRYFASLALIYKLNRDMQIKGEVRQDWMTSTAPGVAYTATSYLLGLRLQ